MMSLLFLKNYLSQRVSKKESILLQKHLLLTFSILLVGTVSLQPSQAQSIKSASDGINTIIKQSGNQFNITGGRLSGDQTNLFQSFSQFSLDQNQIANFLSQSKIRNILGRVVGGNPSVINGLIQVTGGGNPNLFLMNPAGIVFGTHAQLNVPASFTATTATGIGFGNNLWFNANGLNDYTSLVGNPESFAFNLNQPGSIINAGSLQVGRGQNIFLLGGNVINTGTLTAPEGNLTIAAVPGTSLVKVSQEGHLLNLEIAPQQGNTVAGITPLTLAQLLTGGGLNPVTRITVDPTGQISLTGSEVNVPSGGVAIVSGNLNVAGQTGGAVNVLGNSVNLINANINAAEVSGGGQVLIGGDEHGQGTVPNAQSTFVDQNTLINADALTSGNGGKVIVWSDNNTVFAGNISAIGGSQNGNGGFVETSGKNHLTISKTAQVNTSALKGQTGTWLLDPTDLNVVGDDSGTGTITGGNNSSADSTINNSTIVTALNGNNVTLTASNSITVNSAIDASANISAGNLELSTPTTNLNAPITLVTGSTLSGTAPTVNVGSGGLIQNGVDVATVGGSVNLAVATYTVTQPVAINKSLTLTGMGSSSTTVSGGNTTQVFDISGAATINTLTITNGKAMNGGGIGVENGSTLNLNNSIVSNNQADFGAGIYNIGANTVITKSTISGNQSSYQGGGVYTQSGTVTINYSTISNNSATYDGSGFYNTSGTLTINNSTIYKNSSGGNGAGIFNILGSTAIINNSTIDNNSASSGGTVPTYNRGGGGIFNNNNSTVTINNSTVSGNQAVSNGGGINNFSGTVTINNSTIANNSTTNNSTGGDQIYNLSNLILENNSSIIGGSNIGLVVDGSQSSLSLGNTAFSGQLGNYISLINGALVGQKIDATAVTFDSLNGTTATLSQLFAIEDKITHAVDDSSVGYISVKANNVFVTPNSNSIQRGINAASSGNIVNVEAGTYTGDSTVNVNQPVNLIFDSTGATISNGSLTTSANGTIGISGSLIVPNGISFNDPINLLNNVTLTGSSIAFNKTVDGNSNLTANTGSGNLTFAGAIGGISPLDDISTTSTGTTSFNAVTANSLTINAGGTTQMNGNITTAGTIGQTFSNAVQLLTDVSVNSNNQNIIFGSSINGSVNLTVNAGANNATFIGALGNANPLDNLTVTGNSINVDLTKVRTTGTQTYNGTLFQGLQGNLTINNELNFSNPIKLTADAVLNFTGNTDSITFPQGLNGAYDLTLNRSTGKFSLSGTLGDITPLSSLTINAPSSNLQASITTTGDQNYNGMTTLGSSNLTANNGNINFTDTVNLTNTSTLKAGGSINFFKTVDGNQNLNLTAGGDINFDSAVGSNTPLAVLTINNADNFTGGNINAGSVNQTNGTGNTTLGNVTTTSGRVSLTNRNDITTGDITTNGQDINLNGKDVSTGNVNSSAADGGGNITLLAGNQITTKTLDSSATIGNGGNVTLDPLSIEVDSINAQGGTAGSGGTVDITSLGSFRATGTFTDRNGILASISTAGGAGSGDITIRYGAAFPFTVGNAIIQGTAGAITSDATNVIAATRSFTTNYTQGNISLIPYQPIPNFKELDKPLEIAQPISQETALKTDEPEREAISRSLSQGSPEAAVLLIETLWDKEYTNYYGKDLQTTAELPTAATIKTVLQKITQQTGKKPAIVYLISQPDSLEIVVVTPEGKILHKSQKSVNRQALLQLTKEFRSRLIVSSNKTNYKSSSQKLYDLIIKPIEPDLVAEKIDTLLFSADSGLRSLPFAALYDGHQFLVEKYSLSIIPSIGLIDTRYQSLRNAKILVMGASKFVQQHPLPGVVLELPTVAESFGQKRFFINEQFTVSNLLAQRHQQPTQIIHLATHGYFNPGTPKDSYIQFWNQEKLQLDQIRKLGLKNPPVELLVLSACRTALGNDEVELGFAGLAVQAGVKSSLASLWSVDDEGTLGLMSEFYQKLKTTSIKAEALRQAQIAMIKGQVNVKNGELRGTMRGDIPLPSELGLSSNIDLSHPYYWAAFTMIGSPW